MLSIEKIKKIKQGYKIYLSNQEELNVSEDTLVVFRLLKGQEITLEKLAEIKAHTGYQTGLQLALNYLSYQLRTEKEIEDYLKKHEILKTDRKTVQAKLKELKLVDDLIYSESYVRTQIRISDKGPRVIKQKLKQKGVNDGTIEQALLLFSEEDQLILAKKVIEKSAKRAHHKSHRELQQKTQQTLMQKGFDSAVIQQALAEEPQEIDEAAEYAALVHLADKLWRRYERLPESKRQLKVKQMLFQKGYSFDMIQNYLTEKEEFDE